MQYSAVTYIFCHNQDPHCHVYVMTYVGDHFKPVYRADNDPACGMMLFEPPFSVPVCYSWDSQTVEDWLVCTGFGRYRPHFRKNSIQGRQLLALTDDDLRNMNIIDRHDASGIMGNIQMVRQTYRHMHPEELPGLPYNYYRALYFGDQPPVPRRGEISYSTPSVNSTQTVRRLQGVAGEDQFGWFHRNRPTPLI
ncbi:protein pob1 [Biomphalaria pfeifferi]|uniref:Protein pob1 n=1 Tax=Biomphalaria pfeifferi TaxID=112525 RepID=A0AAD8FBY2_BIOPF|nr:protein pob1 [Biomphalaria pfeifferi]